MPEGNDLPGSIIGYRKDGRPIHLIAGGAPEEGEGGEGDGNVTMTKEQLDKLLADARSRAYSQAEKAKAEADETKARLAELEKDRADRVKAEEKARKDAEAAAKKAAEAEMSAKELIDARSAEWQAKYESLGNEWAAKVQGLETTMAQREAVFEKERSFQELATYTMSAVNAHADQIAPELVDYITGNSKEEIDASIARAVEKTNAILAGVQQAQVQARAAMPGVSTGGFTPTGPMEQQGATRTLTPQDIAAMSQDEYAAFRMQPGQPGSRAKDKGIFG